jgi:hypothetical protein
MNRRSFLTAGVATVATAIGGAATSGNVACDVWTRDEGDCPDAATRRYADPSVNRSPGAPGPRHFCDRHTGCATLPLAPIDA